MHEKTLHKIENINKEFEKRGFFIKEDLDEFFYERADIVERLDKIKYNKIEFFDFKEGEQNSVGFTLDDAQIEFFLTYGEDEEGPWYEAEAEILFFGGEE